MKFIMKKSLRHSILLSLFIYIVGYNVYAASSVHAEEIFPVGCTPLRIQDAAIHLSSSKPTVIMFHNLSNKELWLTSTTQNADAQAGWNSRLETNRWSSLALNKKDFVLHCIESMPGHEQQVPCTNIVAVCQWKEASLPSDQAGTFWAGENMLLSSLIAYIERHGFVLRMHRE